jgi:hypothetical protein
MFHEIVDDFLKHSDVAWASVSPADFCQYGGPRGLSRLARSCCPATGPQR